jgi:hypothetical protein
MEWRNTVKRCDDEAQASPQAARQDSEEEAAGEDKTGAKVMWNTMDTLPDVGRKFICLYDDGSGAAMFWRHDAGYIDQDGDECRLERGKYDRWAYLPDELEFWCETRPEDPMTLSLTRPHRKSL